MKPLKTNKFSFARKLSVITTLVLVIAVAISSCSKKKTGNILGAGASFPYPVYSEMFAAYSQETGVKVNYQSIGSGGGIKQITAQTVDFGATDAYIKDDALDKLAASGKKILHIPMVLGGVAVIYKIPGVNKTLQLTGLQIGKIFAGEITKWNDSSLQSTNPNISLPNENIIVVHRSDSSGTTAVFSFFLNRHSPNWQKNFGTGKTIEWFNGSIGAKGNEGVSSTVKQTDYSIGYANFNYAVTQNISYAAIQNLSDQYIEPSVYSISAAAAYGNSPDTRVSLSAVGVGSGAYPISSYTWLLVYADQKYGNRTIEDATLLRDLLTWMVKDGQSYTEELYYSPLPNATADQALTIINSITYDGDNF